MSKKDRNCRFLLCFVLFCFFFEGAEELPRQGLGMGSGIALSRMCVFSKISPDLGSLRFRSAGRDPPREELTEGRSLKIPTTGARRLPEFPNAKILSPLWKTRSHRLQDPAPELGCVPSHREEQEGSQNTGFEQKDQHPRLWVQRRGYQISKPKKTPPFWKKATPNLILPLVFWALAGQEAEKFVYYYQKVWGGGHSFWVAVI